MHLFLDANALFSDWQRSVWLSWAYLHPGVRLFHSELVLDECFRNLVRLNHLTPEGAESARAQWIAHPAVHAVDGFHAYWPDVRSVDEKDRHVAAAALKVRHMMAVPEVQLITWNVRDFPRPALKRVGVIRLSPDEFFLQVFKRDAAVVQAVMALSLDVAQAQQDVMRPHLSPYQCRASGFPQLPEQWPDFLRRTGFRQLANAWASRARVHLRPHQSA